MVVREWVAESWLVWEIRSDVLTFEGVSMLRLSERVLSHSS
jgi:hypothetical protein